MPWREPPSAGCASYLKDTLRAGSQTQKFRPVLLLCKTEIKLEFVRLVLEHLYLADADMGG